MQKLLEIQVKSILSLSDHIGPPNWNANYSSWNSVYTFSM